MENASKALIMAGGVLISIIIASMLMLMVNNLNNYQQSRNDEKRIDQTVAFNQQYEGYNRDDVRGNELYSLINRVMDYNERKTDLEDETDQYEPIEITIDFDGKNQELSRTGTNEIFTSNISYKNTTSNNNYKRVEELQEIDALKNITIQKGTNNPEYKDKDIYLTDEILNNLVIGYDKIFNKLSINSKEEEIAQVAYNFNSATGIDNFFLVEYDKNGNITKNNSLYIVTSFKFTTFLDEIQTYVNKYYEYVQFKRGIFKCTSVEYSLKTGRIIEMDFIFTGEFN